MSANTSRTVGPEGVEWQCRAGHRWADARGGMSACPDCGERGLPRPPAGDSTTFAPRAAGSPCTALLPGGGMPDVPGYEVLGELGRGGMGVVYKARQIGLNRLVALKMILPGNRSAARFETEARAVAQLHHPSIVQVYEVNRWQPGDGGVPVPYYSMEYCPGGSLERFLDSTPLPPPEAGHLVAMLARAIAHAHAQGVIHRDLKPANVLLAREVAPPADNTQASAKATVRPGPRRPTDAATLPPVESIEPKIADFGLAKLLDEQGQTRTGDVMGTPSYMAPEQAEGKPVGPPADVWALGAILYECLTGHPPFRGSNGMETMLNVLNVEPVPPRRVNPRVPADLETVCLKCLHKDPRRRYPGAADLARDLERFGRGEPIQARRVGTVERFRRWAGQNRTVTGLLAAVAALSLMLVLSLAGPRPRRAGGPRAIRVEVGYLRDRVKAAAEQVALDRAARVHLEKQLIGLEVEMARERARAPGPKQQKRMHGFQADAHLLRQKVSAARKLEFESASHESRMRQELELRERELHAADERLKDAQGEER